jgi:hypothetical protein
VVLTAPIPGVSTPSFPFGGAILTGLRIHFPLGLVFERFVTPAVVSARVPRGALCGTKLNMMMHGESICKSFAAKLEREERSLDSLKGARFGMTPQNKNNGTRRVCSPFAVSSSMRRL